VDAAAALTTEAPAAAAKPKAARKPAAKATPAQADTAATDGDAPAPKRRTTRKTATADPT
jgi:hypothetical protein